MQGDIKLWESRKHFQKNALSVESAQMMVNKLPSFGKKYHIDIYVDMMMDGHIPINGWDILGGAEPDKVIINGRIVDNYYNYAHHKVVCSSEKFTSNLREQFSRRYKNVLPCVTHGNTSLVVHYC